MILTVKYLIKKSVETLNIYVQMFKNVGDYTVKLCINLLTNLSASLDIIAITLFKITCIFGEMKKPCQVTSKTGQNILTHNDGQLNN